MIWCSGCTQWQVKRRKHTCRNNMNQLEQTSLAWNKQTDLQSEPRPLDAAEAQWTTLMCCSSESQHFHFINYSDSSHSLPRIWHSHSRQNPNNQKQKPQNTTIGLWNEFFFGLISPQAKGLCLNWWRSQVQRYLGEPGGRAGGGVGGTEPSHSAFCSPMCSGNI